jgi:hypothetical protein
MQFRRLLIFRNTGDRLNEVASKMAVGPYDRRMSSVYPHGMSAIHHIGNMLSSNRCGIHLAPPVLNLSSIPTCITVGDI